jgi:hypothetical protein
MLLGENASRGEQSHSHSCPSLSKDRSEYTHEAEPNRTSHEEGHAALRNMMLGFESAGPGSRSGGAVSPRVVEMIDTDAGDTEGYSPLECLVNSLYLRD